MKTISVFENFSEFPALRHCNISEKSGEEFYHTILNKEFNEQYEKGEKLIVNLDNTAGYASSFLDEAFGNLVFDFTLDIVKNHVEVISIQEPHWKTMIENETYPQWEERRVNKKNPVVTRTHGAWFRLDKNEIKSGIWEHPVAA
ncbi:MAG: STAS-like domain-containing protein [Bacteroidia bacterium]